MRARTDRRSRVRPGWSAGIVAAVLLSACAGSGPGRPRQVVVEDDGGFTITEQVQVGEEVRADFEQALLLLKQGRNEPGIALLLEVTQRVPNVTAPHIDLGIAYGRVGDLERAQAHLERALELNPRHPVALNELGILQRRQGRFRQARKSYEKALSVRPDFHFARRNLAILCDVYLADLGCALEHYQAYTEAVPEDEAAAMWVADLRNRMGE